MKNGETAKGARKQAPYEALESLGRIEGMRNGRRSSALGYPSFLDSVGLFQDENLPRILDFRRSYRDLEPFRSVTALQ